MVIFHSYVSLPEGTQSMTFLWCHVSISYWWGRVLGVEFSCLQQHVFENTWFMVSPESSRLFHHHPDKLENINKIWVCSAKHYLCWFVHGTSQNRLSSNHFDVSYGTWCKMPLWGIANFWSKHMCHGQYGVYGHLFGYGHVHTSSIHHGHVYTPLFWAC